MSGAMTLGGGCLVYSILIDIAKQLLLWIAVAVLLSVMGIPSGIGQAKAVDECSALIANGCFEVGTLGGWKKRNAKVSSSKARSGNYSAQLGNGKSRSGSIVQTIRHLQPHTQYVIEAWLSTSANNPMGRLKLEAYGGKRILRTVKLSQEWQSVSIEFTTGSKANSAKITCQVQELAVKGGVAYCDDLRLLPRGQPDSSATAIPSAIPQPSPLPTPHPTVPP